MEFIIEPLKIPEKIFSFNYGEMMEWAKKEAESYKSIVCTEKDLPEMKKDRAEANRKIKAINDERIRRKKEWMKPYEEFEARVKRVTGVLQEVSDFRGEQIREVEDRIKQEKKKKIEEYFSTTEPPEWLTLPMIWDEKWLNASVSMKSIQEQINAKAKTISSDLTTLSDLPEVAFEAIETYKTTLDLNKSIAEGHRLSEMQKRKAEQERIKAEQERLRKEQEKAKTEQEETMRNQMMSSFAERGRQAAAVTTEEIAESAEAYREAADAGGVHMPEELSKQWVSFKAFLSVADAKALKEFFEIRNIEFGRI